MELAKRNTSPLLPTLSQSLCCALLSLILLNGCSSYGVRRMKAPPVTTPGKSTNNAVRPASSGEATGVLSDVVVYWEPVNAAVTGYLLEYGHNPSTLSRSKRVALEDLEYHQSEGGKVLVKTMLPAIPSEQPLYVSVRTYSGDEVSAPSSITMVPAE